MCILPNDRKKLRVVTYEDRYREDFATLNLQWIEKYFHIEEADRQLLFSPRESIIDKGGEIFFIVAGEEVKGTCALIPHGESVWELAKMAIAEDCRGRGMGNLLMEKAISYARENKVQRLYLASNIRLAPAIHLYKKYGFVTTRLGQHEEYERANIEMELEL